MNAVDALSFDHYSASVAVVYDEDTGKDHAIIVRRVDGRVETIYKRDHKQQSLASRGKQFPATVTKQSSSKAKKK